jgi:hypothetical protein
MSEPIRIKDLPRRVAHATHALMESSSPYAYGMGPRTTREVMEYDSEALTLSSTFGALSRAMKRGLVARTFGRPALWFPTNLAHDLRGPLEDRFLLDTEEL